MDLHVGLPNIGDRDAFHRRVIDILDSARFTNAGPFVREFEAKICEVTGVKYAVATCNATVALEILIRALDLKGEVIVPSFTFPATAHALSWLGIKPVFADIHPDTHLIDPRHVNELITPKTTGIIGVHIWGQRCDVLPLQEIADHHGLKLIFDAAHSFPYTGGFGEAEVFSFHATKFINSFEGGAIVTNNRSLARKCRRMKNFGFQNYEVRCRGTNGKMSEISAAFGLTSIESMDKFLECNTRNYMEYKHNLKDIKMLGYAPPNNDQYIVIQIPNRDQVMNLLWEKGIRARRYFYPGIHRMRPYNSPKSLPVTEKVCEEVLVLPTGECVSHKDIARISRLILSRVSGADSLS